MLSGKISSNTCSEPLSPPHDSFDTGVPQWCGGWAVGLALPPWRGAQPAGRVRERAPSTSDFVAVV